MFKFRKMPKNDMGGGYYSENKKLTNKKKIIIIGVVMLLGISIGIATAYFVSKNGIDGSGKGSLEIKTAKVNGTELSIEAEGDMNPGKIYPGHKSLIKLTVSALYDNGEIKYNVIWEGKNTLETPITYKIYKLNEEQEAALTNKPSISCEVINGNQNYEECKENYFDGLGEVYTYNGQQAQGTIMKTEEDAVDNAIQTLIKNETIIGREPARKVYYYVEIDYPNLNKSQGEDKGKGYDGHFKIEIVTDSESPSEPKMNYRDGHIALSDSHDNLTDDVSIRYKYSIDCTDEYEDGSDIDLTQLEVNNHQICAIAEDAAGNKSDITRKNLSIIASANGEAKTRYRCEDGTYASDTDGCTKKEQRTQTQRYTQACNTVDNSYASYGSAITTSTSSCSSRNDSCSTQSDASSNHQKISCTVTNRSFSWSSGGRSKVSSCSSRSSNCSSAGDGGNTKVECDTDATYHEVERACESFDYTNCSEYGYIDPCTDRAWNYCVQYVDGPHCFSCSPTYSTYKTTSVCVESVTYNQSVQTCEWHQSSTHQYGDPVKQGTVENSCSDPSENCTINTNNCSAKGGSCSSSGSCSGTCQTTCTVKYTGEIQYICSLTSEQTYSSQDEATRTCTNYCSAGLYYDSKCYNLTDL